MYGIGIFYNTYEMLGYVNGFAVIFGGTYNCPTYIKNISDYNQFELFSSMKELQFSPKIVVIILFLVAIGLLAMSFLAFKKRLKKISLLAFVSVILSLVAFIVAVEMLNIGLGEYHSESATLTFKPNDSFVKNMIFNFVGSVITTIVGILLVPLKDKEDPEVKRNKDRNKRKEYKNDYPFLG